MINKVSSPSLSIVMTCDGQKKKKVSFSRGKGILHPYLIPAKYELHLYHIFYLDLTLKDA